MRAGGGGGGIGTGRSMRMRRRGIGGGDIGGGGGTMTRRSMGMRGRGGGSTTIIGGTGTGMGREALVSICLFLFLGPSPLFFHLGFLFWIPFPGVSSCFRLAYSDHSHVEPSFVPWGSGRACVWEKRLDKTKWVSFFLFIYLGSCSGRGECMLAGSMNDELDDIPAFEGTSQVSVGATIFSWEPSVLSIFVVLIRNVYSSREGRLDRRRSSSTLHPMPLNTIDAPTYKVTCGVSRYT